MTQQTTIDELRRIIASLIWAWAYDTGEEQLADPTVVDVLRKALEQAQHPGLDDFLDALRGRIGVVKGTE